MAYTIGITSPSTDGASAASADRAWVSKVTSVAAGTMVRGTVCFGAGTTGTDGKFIVLSSVGGEPGAVLAVSGAVSIPAGASITSFTLGGEAVTASTEYYIGVVTYDYPAEINYTLGSGFQTRMANGTFSYASPPGSWPGSDGTYADVAESVALEIEDVVAGPTMGYLRPNRLRPRLFGPGNAR